MRQETRDKLIFLVLLSVKILTAVRTGIDTFLVSGDLLNVLLIDGAFLALWVMAAYGGRSGTALSLRPFAAFGAWVLYALMVFIGWEAHQSAVALAVRAAGSFALAYDTADYIVSVAQRMRFKRNAETTEAWQSRIDNAEFRKRYVRAMRNTQAAKAQVACDVIAETRIQSWLRKRDRIPDALPASVGAYNLLDSGHIECADCGWVSARAYESAANAQNAFAAHTRSTAHR